MTDPDHRSVHVNNWSERLLLEQYLQREFFNHIPFLCSFVLFLVLLNLERPDYSIFEIHENISTHLSLSSTADIHFISDAYSYFTTVFFPAVSLLSPLDTSYVSVSNATGAVVPNYTQLYTLATAMIGTPLLYAIRSSNTTDDCLKSSVSFAPTIQTYYPDYFYCGLNLTSVPDGLSCSSRINSTDFQSVISCANFASVNQTTRSDDTFYLFVDDAKYGTVKASVLPVTNLNVFSALQANNWIDSTTSLVSARSLFYSPQQGVYTACEVRMAISEAGRVSATYALESKSDIANDPTWVSVLIACLFFALVQMTVDLWNITIVVRTSLNSFAYLGRGMGGDSEGWVGPVFHVICGSAQVIQLLMKLVSALPVMFTLFASSTTPVRIDMQDALTSILDANPSTQPEFYTNAVFHFIDLLALGQWLRIFSVIVLALESIRFLLFIAVHPRLSSVISTIAFAGDDLLNFFVIFIITNFILAYLGAFAIGDQLSAYATVGDLLYQQLQNLTGNFDFSSFIHLPDQFMVVLYNFTFCLFGYFICQNFYIAIVVDAFQKFKEVVAEYSVEKSVPFDLVFLVKAYCRAWIENWPPRHVVIIAIEDFKVAYAEESVPRAIPFVALMPFMGNEYHDGGQRMFDYYEATFCQEPDDVLHPENGVFVEIRPKLLDAVADLEELTVQITTHVREGMADLRKMDDATTLNDLAFQLEEAESLKSELKALELEKDELEMKLMVANTALLKARGETPAPYLLDKRASGQSKFEQLIQALTEQEELLESARTAREEESERNPSLERASAASYISLNSSKSGKVITGLTATLDEEGYEQMKESKCTQDDYEVFAERLARSKGFDVSTRAWRRVSRQASENPEFSFDEFSRQLSELN